jgi:hypothetical protein
LLPYLLPVAVWRAICRYNLLSASEFLFETSSLTVTVLRLTYVRLYRIHLSIASSLHLSVSVMIASISLNASGFMHAILVTILLLTGPGLRTLVIMHLVNFRARTLTIHGHAPFRLNCCGGRILKNLLIALGIARNSARVSYRWIERDDQCCSAIGNMAVNQCRARRGR